ncbi:MAG TPA: hypothetical protein VHL78_04935 [Actinomycetota bacterium]|nr:hypothetical protein [Actinomycetota bacterium]
MAEVVVGRAPDGSWEWRYRAPGAADIVANRVFRTKEAAVASARLAYPGVQVRSERAALAAGRGRWLVAVAAATAVAVAFRRRRTHVRVRPVGAGPQAG